MKCAGDSMKKWILLDVMGVIFTIGDDTNDLLVPFVRRYNKSITRAQINTVYLEASLGSTAISGCLNAGFAIR